MLFKRTVACLISLAILGLLVSAPAVAGFFSKYEKAKPVAGEVRIPIEDINDGKAHYFLFEDEKQVVKFFVVKSADGTIRAAFDACDVCFSEKKGYSQQGDYMVCNNCGRKFHSNRINVIKGGCNPAPLRRAVQGNELVIRVADIVPGARYF
ncbi:MAG: DUF2318 domain-containing protein [Desulfocapsaceae bacterium]|nr:DUF2318 domain-containing protein [Desulfocapsaceae bacterium]